MPAAKHDRDYAQLIDCASTAIAGIATVVFVIQLLMRSNSGYDFSDEGFYLNWISHPLNFPKLSTQFGYVYHPLYELFGRSIASLRQANILITFLLALTVCFCLLRRFARDAGGTSSQSFSVVGLSIVGASSSLLILILVSAFWLPTPSYNSLLFQSFLMTSIGLCLAENDRSATSILGWLIIGVGGFLAFMGKPPSAVALGLLVIVSLWIARKLAPRMIALSVAMFGMLLAAYACAVSGSIAQFVTDLYQSLKDSATFGSAPVFRYDAVQLSIREVLVLAALTLVLTALTLTTFSKSIVVRMLGTIAILILSTLTLVLSIKMVAIGFEHRAFQGLQFLSIILASAICFAILRPSTSISKSCIGLSLFFALLPCAYILGSGNNYWQVGGTGAFFLMLSGFSLVTAKGWSSESWRHLAPLSIVSLAMTIVFVQHGMAHPYREPGSLLTNTVPVRIGTTGRLLVNPDSAAYIETLQRFARNAGFQAGTPMIDLTGVSPGSLFVLAAKPLGSAWLIGGYPGSNALATKNLDLVSCHELAGSWILTEINGPRPLSPDLLLKYGIDLTHDFDVAGTLHAPTGSFSAGHQQQLLKPKRSLPEAVSACEAARTAAK
jgi:hypothetical protein